MDSKQTVSLFVPEMANAGVRQIWTEFQQNRCFQSITLGETNQHVGETLPSVLGTARGADGRQ